MAEFAKFQGIGYTDAVSLGLVAKHSRAGGFGNNPDVDTNTVPEDAWTGGGLYPWMVAATLLQIRSTSASDTAAGVGTHSVLVSGLDINFVPISQTVTLNGTAAVAIPTALYRINSVLPGVPGSSQVNVGDIIVEDVAAGNTVRAIAPAGYGTTRQAPYTVPVGCNLLIKQLYLGILSPAGVGGRAASLSTYFKFTGGMYRLPITITTANNISYLHIIDPPISLTAGTDFSLRITNLSDSNSDITGAWNGILVQN